MEKIKLKMKKELPKKLYKYRKFNENTLRMLYDAECFLADPIKLNDPLDNKPFLIEDKTSIDDLRRLVFCLCEQNDAYAARIIEKCERKSRLCVKHIHDTKINNINFNRIFAKELFGRISDLFNDFILKSGIFSMSSRWDSSLMWSHYSDGHKGICIEYDVKPELTGDKLFAVNYELDRTITCNDLLQALVYQKEEYNKKIFERVYVAKASDWAYEQEYRLIEQDTQGTASSRFNVSAIYFGMNSSEAVIGTIVNLMKSIVHSFYSVRCDNDGFTLLRDELSKDNVYEPKPSPHALYNNQGNI